MTTFYGVPPEWKNQQRRWYCPHCFTEGWSADGSLPPHDTFDGKPCRKSGALTEHELRTIHRQMINKINELWP